MESRVNEIQPVNGQLKNTDSKSTCARIKKVLTPSSSDVKEVFKSSGGVAILGGLDGAIAAGVSGTELGITTSVGTKLLAMFIGCTFFACLACVCCGVIPCICRKCNEAEGEKSEIKPLLK